MPPFSTPPKLVFHQKHLAASCSHSGTICDSPLLKETTDLNLLFLQSIFDHFDSQHTSLASAR